MVAQDRLKQEIYNLSEQVERLTAANRYKFLHVVCQFTVYAYYIGLVYVLREKASLLGIA